MIDQAILIHHDLPIHSLPPFPPLASILLWQSEKWPPKNVRVPILRTYEYVTLHGKKNFAYVIKNPEMGILS